MNKYDFGYCLESNPTNQWAFDQIDPHSRVLELGPAFGVLTKHLTEEKNCVVDIVEIDCVSGEKARVFANNAIIGNAGDLQKDAWFTQLAAERYDYIVALDVLEHLSDPLAVLQKAKTLLKANGRMILSVPNLAHNAVIAQLINNSFSYTNVGLLDNTHVHFFAYHDLLDMMHDAGMHIDCIDGILKPLNGTEIPVSWDDVSPQQASVLKDRVYGDVYQLLLTASHQKDGEGEDDYCNKLGDGRIADELPSISIVINGQVEQAIVCPMKDRSVSCEFSCAPYSNVENIRIVFPQECMLVSDVCVHARNQSKEWPLHYNWTSGVAISKKAILISDARKCEINYALDECAESIHIHLEHTWIDTRIASLLENDITSLVNQANQAAALKESLKAVQRENKTAWEQFSLRDAERNEELTKRLDLEETNRRLEAEKEELDRQLEASNTDCANAWAQFAERETQRNEELARRLDLEETNRRLEAEKEELDRQLEASNTDRANAWKQFAEREAQRNAELVKRLDLEEACRKLEAEKEELDRQLEAVSADRANAWKQFAQRDADRNEELAKRLELEEVNRRLAAEGEEFRRQIAISDADRTTAWERLTERDRQLAEANAHCTEMQIEMDDLQLSYQREKERTRLLLAKIEKLEKSAIIRCYEKVKRI